MDRIRLDIVTPDRKVLSQEVDEVILPGELGALGVLPGHTELLTLLRPGPLELRDGNKSDHYAVSGGYAEVGPNKVIVLADTAEHAADIDVTRAQSAQKRAEESLGDLEMSGEHYASAQAALSRATVRIEVAGLVRDRR